MPENYKIAIVGAASLRGKELNETLNDSVFSSAEFLLMDDESALGQLETVGDEVTFIQRIEPDAFRGVDFVFFASDEEITRKHWQSAQKAGASIIDMSYALESTPGVLLRAPWVQDWNAAPDLKTTTVSPAHPAAFVLALLLKRAQTVASVVSAAATVMEPASEYGRSALDELHQQTVGLLSFQSLPKQMYDAQVAFNVVPSLGEAARVSLMASEARIRRHYAHLAEAMLPDAMIQLLHVPVFHGYGISLAISFDEPVTLDHLETALGGEHVEVVLSDSDAPSNLSSAGQSDVLVRVRTADGTELATKHFWVWMVADNLKLAALNALACAQELRFLRPQGKVQ
ncbi:Asd/ArgC dimerization domain-containing protein [Pseudacidobacterium ailaaui]|jgi:aspartate-semialdehyde dehydrogenase|uniref:Asd/ArgC dimerization domain-containing protein n=1 Tax=Pseudacidobacterium ailaaui TaxID=1382359 RepID=UPI00047C19B7|nr:Asd/ArgC dimerization domain-containing protein [Pseudacidobacterium ailaaui]